MSVLMRANPDYIDTVVFGGGVELFIPDPESEAVADLPPWREDE